MLSRFKRLHIIIRKLRILKNIVGIQNAIIPCALCVHRHALSIYPPARCPRTLSFSTKTCQAQAVWRTGDALLGGLARANIVVHRGTYALAPESWRMNLMLLPCEPTLPGHDAHDAPWKKKPRNLGVPSARKCLGADNLTLHSPGQGEPKSNVTSGYKR